VRDNRAILFIYLPIRLARSAFIMAMVLTGRLALDKYFFMNQKNLKPSRREILKSAVLGSALLSPLFSLPVFAHSTATASGIGRDLDHQPDPPANVNGDFPSFKYKFTDSEKRSYSGGWAREATVKQFPVSKGLAGVDMLLHPGATRELHWHAIAAEWAFMLEGTARITIIDPEGKSEMVDFGPGDVWYFPKGFGHSIQALDKGAHFVLVFDSGYFSEFGTFSVTDWVAHTPIEVLSASTGLPASVFAKAPDHEAYIVTGPVPPLIPLDPPDGSTLDAPASHKFRMLAEQPTISLPGGSVRIVSSLQFPVSTTITGVLEVMKPGAARELHWHPNADEWQYYVSGKGRMTVFGSNGRASTDDFEKTDVGYVPQGYGHYIENTGSEDLVVLVALNSGFYEDISLSDWLATVPDQMLVDHFGTGKDAWKGRPREKLIIGLRK
jgi:oxalate decarboxylase